MLVRSTILFAAVLRIAIPASPPTLLAVTNAASFASGPLSPGEIAVLFGSNLGPSSLVSQTLSNNQYGTTLAGTQVLFNGIAAPLIYTSAGQVAAVVPFAIAGQTSVTVQVIYLGAASAAIPIPVSLTQPALWSANASGRGPGAVLNQDGTLNTGANPAAVGSVIQLFGTGAGLTVPASLDGSVAGQAGSFAQAVSVTIGNVAAQGIVYAGPAPGQVAGVFQFNVTIPAGVPSGSAVPVVVSSGGNSSPSTVTIAVHGPSGPALVSIAMSPASVSLTAGSTKQLTVNGTDSNGLTQPLVPSEETFKSSNTNVATVSAVGILTISPNAVPGATATITVTDNASGLTANSTSISVVAPGNLGPPMTNSVSAATATAKDNAVCTAITPFYWEIGNSSAPLASASIGTDSSGDAVLATTQFSIASASKWVYGTYVAQLRGSATGLTTPDIDFLHFTSGYTNMGSDTTSSECPSTNTPDTVNTCLGLINAANNLSYSYQSPNTIGRFDYDSGHLENHASLYGGLGDVRDTMLGTTVGTALGSSVTFIYTEPLLAGGIYASSNFYTQMLRNILSGSLFMHDALGTNPVCTSPSAPGCNAVYSPIPEAWHYSMAHWVEDDPATNGDGAFSSAGAFGFYPWIEASKTYYGVISRQSPTGDGEQNGYASARCGRLIRHAWDTGLEQTGTIPK